MVINKDELWTAHTDLTGRFPCRSSRDDEYLLIAYHYDGNFIVSLKNRKKETITAALTYLYNQFSTAGVASNTYVMDSEISQELIAAMVHNKTSYQLAPPHTHRRNLAERAIRTYKNHLKAILASLDPEFPLIECDRLIKQFNITLSLLRSARANPSLFSYTHIFG